MKKMRNKRKSIRKIVIDTFTGIMFMVFLLSMCAMDSEQIEIPTISMAVSFAWCVLYSWANGWLMGGDK